MTEFYENKHQKYFHEIFFYFISLNSLNTGTVPVQYIELFPGSGIIVPDPDPAKSERADKDK